MLKAGMSYKSAFCFNLLSSLTAVVGMFIGATISSDETVRVWIFTVTAGMFLYIALSDMVGVAIMEIKWCKINVLC